MANTATKGGPAQRGQGVIATLSTAQRRAVLTDRASRLAQRGLETQSAPRERMLVCEVGPNLYGLSLTEVRRIAPFQRRGAAPARSAAAMGLVADGGAIRPVLDLASLLGAGAPAAASGWLVLLASPHRAALRLDTLPEAAEVEPLDTADPDRLRIVGGEHHDKVLVRLSPTDLLANPTHGAQAP
ncbi:chemotaxis protein CheW [Phenylobacterium sp.]|jgi:chemotaxis signal transduction protein|uniref:chemotaxis protein CheW n=1 Tax=Phenylobacterium sp. TaxID=1871053 RepID=UPI0037850A03